MITSPNNMRQTSQDGTCSATPRRSTATSVTLSSQERTEEALTSRRLLTRKRSRIMSYWCPKQIFVALLCCALGTQAKWQPKTSDAGCMTYTWVYPQCPECNEPGYINIGHIEKHNKIRKEEHAFVCGRDKLPCSECKDQRKIHSCGKQESNGWGGHTHNKYCRRNMKQCTACAPHKYGTWSELKTVTLKGETYIESANNCGMMVSAPLCKKPNYSRTSEYEWGRRHYYSRRSHHLRYSVSNSISGTGDQVIFRSKKDSDAIKKDPNGAINGSVKLISHFEGKPCIYEGMFKNDIPDGQGKLYLESNSSTKEGNVYDGLWSKGYKNGHGINTEIKANGKEVYDGNWKDGRREGQGKQTYPNGGAYSGNWKTDQHNGHGEMTYPVGDKDKRKHYKGEWKKDKCSGFGTLTYTNGDVYDGVFNGVPHGDHGVMLYADGHIYAGEFSRGRPGAIHCDTHSGKNAFDNHKQATYLYPDGRVYTGQWMNGFPDGLGKMTYLDGRIEFGQWKENTFMAESLKETSSQNYSPGPLIARLKNALHGISS